MNAAGARRASQTDEALMGRVAGGDSLAFETIYDRYHQRAYSLALRITGATAGAEEATQDAFLSLWRGARSFDPERASLATWLLALVRYRSIDCVRRSAHRTVHQDVTEGAAESLEAPERTDAEVLAGIENDRALRLVAQLPSEQREVIDLAYFKGYTHAEIAARVGVPLGTVKSRARLGLLKLRPAAERDWDRVPTTQSSASGHRMRPPARTRLTERRHQHA